MPTPAKENDLLKNKAPEEIMARHEEPATGSDLRDQSSAIAGQKRTAPSTEEKEEKEMRSAKKVKQEDEPDNVRLAEMARSYVAKHGVQSLTQLVDPDNALLAEMGRSYVAKHGIKGLTELVTTPDLKLCCRSSTPSITSKVKRTHERLKFCVESDSLDWEGAEAMATKLVVYLGKYVSAEHTAHTVVDMEAFLHATYFEKVMRRGIDMNPTRQWRHRVEAELAKQSQ